MTSIAAASYRGCIETGPRRAGSLGWDMIAAYLTLVLFSAPVDISAAYPRPGLPSVSSLEFAVSQAPAHSSSWVRLSLSQSSADAWTVVFAPTPLARRIAISRGSRCEAGPEGFAISTDSASVELAVQIGPGVDDTLRLGRLIQPSKPTEARTVEVTLRRGLKPRPRPRGFVSCKAIQRAATPPPKTEIPESCDLSSASVVLAPGHGPGRNSGGRSARGVDEYVFNDALAEAIRRAIRKRAPISVELTRNPDQDRGLGGRVAFTNRKRPDLMLSVHHDSVADRRRKTIIVEDTQVQTCDEQFGFSLYLDTVDEHARVSYHFARALSDRLLAAGRRVGRFFFWGQLERGIYNGDVLYVLRGADVPAVLFEAGFICNHREEIELSRARYRRKPARLVAAAVIEFFVHQRCGTPPELDTTHLIGASRLSLAPSIAGRGF